MINDDDFYDWKDLDYQFDNDKENRVSFSIKDNNNNKIEITSQAKINIFNASTKFVEGDADSLFELAHLLCSIGYIPEDSINEEIYHSLVLFVTTIKLNVELITTSLDLISSLSSQYPMRFIDVITPDFAKFLLYLVHSHHYLISFFSLESICNLAYLTEEIFSMFIDFGMLTVLDKFLNKCNEKLLTNKKSSILFFEYDVLAISSLFNKIMKYIHEEDSCVFYSIIFRNLLSSPSTELRISFLKCLLNFSKLQPQSLIDNNLHIILFDFLSNDDFALLSAHILYRIVKAIGVSFISSDDNCFGLDSHIQELVEKQDIDSLIYALPILYQIFNNHIEEIEPEMISFFIEKADISTFNIKLQIVIFLSQIILLDIDQNIVQVFVEKEGINLFLTVADNIIDDNKHKIMKKLYNNNDKTVIQLILEVFLMEGTKFPYFSQTLVDNPDFYNFLIKDFEDEKEESLSNELLSIYFPEE